MSSTGSFRGGRGGSGGTGSSRGEAGSGSRSQHVKANLGTIHGDLFTKPADMDKRGSDGEPVKCRANFVAIGSYPEFQIYQYHVQFVPEVDSKSTRMAILKQDTIVQEIGDTFIFDGMILYLTTEWRREEAIEARHPVTGLPVTVSFKNSVRFGHNDAQAINCYNIVIRRIFDQIGLKQMGRNYFDPKRCQNVENEHMQVLPGYETAIRLYEEQLMLCVENRFKMIRTDNMYSIIEDEYKRCRGDLQRFQEKMQETYANSTIMTKYNNKMHRLTRFDFDMTPLSEFTLADGRSVSLQRYFKEQYDIEIRNLQQPIIVSEGKPKQPGEPPQLSFLVPELCYPTGLTDEMRKNFKLMRTLSFHTRLSPEKRQESTLELLQRVKSSKESCALLEAWQICLEDQLVDVQARKLAPQKLIGRNPLGFTGRNAEWARECRNHGNFQTKAMKRWIVVCPIENAEDSRTAQTFIAETQRIGRELQMNVGDPHCEAIGNAEVVTYIEGVKAALEKAGSEPVDMIVLLLKNDNKTRYDTLKKYLCVTSPVPSQCVLMKTIAGKATSGGDNKNLGSIVLKIVLQMNCKMGGALWKVNIPLKNTMIVGYDLYHDSTVRGKTVGACVSTIDEHYTQYYSQTRLHENATELGNNLTHFLRKALRKYYDRNNKALPDRIFLYRDGAGDGQIPYIRDQEVRLVREACADVCQRAGLQKTIQLAFTIVTKKVNMRVFKEAGTNLVNPDPGTVVDSVVTRPERFDFYLVPQFVNQGTVTPVCYNIIADDTGLSPDRHQALAFKLCHLYYNWQGTVRVPAPCQYAHKLAFLVAQSIHKEADECLRDKLFFL